MSNKTGRNEPCPCGSGKKFKKCCGARDAFDPKLPDDLITGTVLDDYMMLIQGIGMFSQSLLQFDAERRILKDAIRNFEECFQPGEPDGVSDSIFLSWNFLDLRFGKSQKTICECFIEAGYAERLRDPGTVLLNNLSESYIAFYLLKVVDDGYLIFEEIGTGKEWHVHRVNEPYERISKTGDLWYVRLLGNPADAYIFTAPYIFPPEKKMIKEIRAEVEFQVSKWAEYPGRSADKGRDFCDSSKASVTFWLSRILDKPMEKPFSPISAGKVVCNTDREKLYFSEVIFKIERHENLEKALSKIKNFEYDKNAGHWVWLKGTKRNVKIYSRTVGGTVRIEGSRLIAETNSLPRALKIKAMIQKALGSDIVYEKIEAKDIASLPPLSAEEQKRIKKETAELNANPEVQAILQKQAYEYYHKSWLRQKIPSLGFITPYEAAKTQEGREELKELLDGLENMQNSMPDNPSKVDVDELRRKLKLI